MNRAARKTARENATEGSSIPVKLRKTVEERQRTTEVDGLLEFGGISDEKPTPPLVDRPNIYTLKKKCARCRQWKMLAAFSPRKENVDGRHSYCKACRAELAKETYSYKRG